VATYQELYGEANSDSLLSQKVIAAAQDYAATILAETAPSASRKGFATAVRDDPNKARELIWPCLIANKAATLAQIIAATDATILTNVQTAVNNRYGAT
jgi:hypothetical protein